MVAVNEVRREPVTELRRIGVVGAGQMGSGFAEVCARAGLDVVVACRSETAAERGKRRLDRSLQTLVSKGKLAEPDRDAAAGHVRFATGLDDLAGSQFVLEAIYESLPDKLELFGKLDAVVDDPQAILASNTSSLPLARLAAATGNPARVVGVHFFNPVQVMPLAEIVSALRTPQSVADRAAAFVTGVLGKQVIHAKDRAGFVVNSLLVPYLLQAVRMLEAGFATAEDIDKGMKLGCGHPMGPLALIDLIGLDTLASVGEAMFAESREPWYAPPPLLRRMTESGLLGRKTGIGFYSYD
jgi:3-hydroxybutyryl-CoA dehydrogenase